MRGRFSARIAREVPGATLVAALALFAQSGCGEKPDAANRRIVPHKLAECPIAPESLLVFTALGDFGSSYAGSVQPASGSAELALPLDLSGVEAASLPPAFRGVGYAPPPDDVHLTLWPTGEACSALPRDDDPDGGSPRASNHVPQSNGGIAMASFANGGAVIVAGLEPSVGGPPRDSAFALMWDARTGAKLAPIGLPDRRAWATATSFGGTALVAGGFDTNFFPAKTFDTALVFRDGSFHPISIVDARARHGAVVLANGSTLLVGGEGQDGKALVSFVVIEPRDPPELARPVLFGLGSLAAPRKSPTVLRLSDDRILVAGGTDDQGNPVDTLEWFESDGSPCCTGDGCPPRRCNQDPGWPVRPGRSFVVLPGGGALAVAADPNGLGPGDAWWILPEGDVKRIDDVLPSRTSSKALRLVGASDGAPWLWNGEQWFRFDPWRAAFLSPAVAPDDGPSDEMPAPVELDPGLFMWLAPVPGEPAPSRARLRGFRHGVRGPLTRDAAPLLFADTDHVSPDRPPEPTSVDFVGQWLTLVRPDAPSPAPRVLVDDTLYADFDLTLETKGPGSASASTTLPDVFVGSIAIGPEQGACPWPAESGARLEMRRRGTKIEIDVDGAPHQCAVPTGRVALALGAPTDRTATATDGKTAVVSQLVITRR